jgi:hypothetical protein
MTRCVLSQIKSQLGPIMHVQYPPLFATITGYYIENFEKFADNTMRVFYPCGQIFAEWRLFVIIAPSLMVSSVCVSILARRWLNITAGILVVLASAITSYWIFDHYSGLHTSEIGQILSMLPILLTSLSLCCMVYFKIVILDELFGHGNTLGGDERHDLKNRLLTVVFLIYPTICNQCFGMLSCRRLGPTRSVLANDYNTLCTDGLYNWYRMFSWIVIVLVVVGAPAILSTVLFHPKSWNIILSPTAEDIYVIKQIQAGKKCDMLEKRHAEDVLHGVVTAETYECLVNFKSQFMFWEVLDMVCRRSPNPPNATLSYQSLSNTR